MTRRTHETSPQKHGGLHVPDAVKDTDFKPDVHHVFYGGLYGWDSTQVPVKDHGYADRLNYVTSIKSDEYIPDLREIREFHESAPGSTPAYRTKRYPFKYHRRYDDSID